MSNAWKSGRRVYARSFAIGPVIYIEYSFFLPTSRTCYCLTFIKAKWRFLLRRELKDKVEAWSINQKDVPSLRDGMKKKLINVGAVQHCRFNMKLSKLCLCESSWCVLTQTWSWFQSKLKSAIPNFFKHQPCSLIQIGFWSKRLLNRKCHVTPAPNASSNSFRQFPITLSHAHPFVKPSLATHLLAIR